MELANNEVWGEGTRELTKSFDLKNWEKFQKFAKKKKMNEKKRWMWKKNRKEVQKEVIALSSKNSKTLFDDWKSSLVHYSSKEKGGLVYEIFLTLGGSNSKFFYYLSQNVTIHPSQATL